MKHHSVQACCFNTFSFVVSYRIGKLVRYARMKIRNLLGNFQWIAMGFFFKDYNEIILDVLLASYILLMG
jgi:hypothetical protein